MATATRAELEAAVAALAGKKRRLRESFDRLVACSPVPVPFRWEDLDAYLASIAASFGLRHLDPVHADAIAAAADGARAAHDVHHPGKEEQGRERGVGRGASEEGQGSSNTEEGEEGRNASSHQERAEEDGEVREASSARADREADEAGNILGAEAEAVPIEAAPEQPDDDEKEEGAMGAVVASPRQRDGDGDVEMEVVVEDEEAEEGEWLQRPRAAGGGEETLALARAVAAACANMDPSALADALCLGGAGSLRALLPALLGRAPDPHALLVRAVGGFLDGPGRERERDASEWWAECVALIECAPRLAAPSPDALAQAKRLAGRWKEMVVVGPAGGSDMGGMAGWGLLTFIASYDIVPEFDADEIILLFDNIAPQVKDSCVELCKRLGLIGKMTASINHFIENGQPLDAIRLAHTFSLTDKYPPLAIMNDYIENAKKTAEDILSKESYTLESLNQAMAKKVDALIFSWSAVDGCDIDSVQRNSIKAEITQLLHKYANKQQSLALAGVSASVSSSHQQQNFQEEHQQPQPQMRLVEQQKQQQKPHHGLHPKPGEERHQQQKAQETQHRHIQNKQEPQDREMWQNRKRKRPNKNRKRKQRRQNLQQHVKRPRIPPYFRAGVDNQHGQPFSGTGRAPFASYTTTIPRYFWSV